MKEMGDEKNKEAKSKWRKGRRRKEEGLAAVEEMEEKKGEEEGDKGREKEREERKEKRKDEKRKGSGEDNQVKRNVGTMEEQKTRREERESGHEGERIDPIMEATPIVDSRECHSPSPRAPLYG